MMKTRHFVVIASLLAATALLAQAAPELYVGVSVTGSGKVLRFDATTGAALPAAGRSGADFTASFSGDISQMHLAGPDDNADGQPDLWVSDPYYNHGTVVSFDGALGDFIQSRKVLTTAEDYTFGMNFTADKSTVLASSRADNVVKAMNLATSVVTTYLTGFNDPGQMIWSPDGTRLYVSQRKHPNYPTQTDRDLVIYDASGTEIGNVDSVGSEDFRGLTWGPDGCLYMTRRYDNTQKYDPSTETTGPGSGTVSTVITRAALGGGTAINNPGGLAFGPDLNGDGDLDLYIGIVLSGTITAKVVRVDAQEGTLLGTFLDETVLPGNSGYMWLEITGMTEPPVYVDGDTDKDGDVDLDDLSTLASNWNVPAGMVWADGDFDADGDVDLDDLSALAANWQYGVTGAVPEPASALALLLLGLSGLLRKRMKR